MDKTRTKTIAGVEIDGRLFVLGEDRDVSEVMADIESAAAGPGPRFVRLVGGEESVSVLISSRSRVIVTVRVENPEQEATGALAVVPDLDWDL